MTVLEAWSYKLPVFMTRHCNLSVGFSSGAAIEISTDPGEMAKTLADTIGGGQLHRLGAAGRRLVEEKFHWAQIAALHLDNYKWLVGQADKPEFVVLD